MSKEASSSRTQNLYAGKPPIPQKSSSQIHNQSSGLCKNVINERNEPYHEKEHV